MKIQDKGPIDPSLAQALKDSKPVAPREQKESVKESSGEPAKVSISPEARRLQQVAELVKQGDQLRAEKVNDIKDKLAQGQLDVKSEDVAKALVRSEIARLLGEE
jgi:flagellar biosynthesis anti-sigma factor FlgM